jgi:hypothetical protein
MTADQHGYSSLPNVPLELKLAWGKRVFSIGKLQELLDIGSGADVAFNVPTSQPLEVWAREPNTLDSGANAGVFVGRAELNDRHGKQ